MGSKQNLYQYNRCVKDQELKPTNPIVLLSIRPIYSNESAWFHAYTLLNTIKNISYKIGVKDCFQHVCRRESTRRTLGNSSHSQSLHIITKRLLHCSLTVSFWSLFRNWGASKTKENIILSNRMISYGTFDNTKHKCSLNHTLLIAKYVLHVFCIVNCYFCL